MRNTRYQIQFFDLLFSVQQLSLINQYITLQPQLKDKLIMGCPSTKQASNEFNQHNNNSLVIIVKRLIISFQGQSHQLVEQAKVLNEKLKRELSKERIKRMKQAQYNILQEIVVKVHLKSIYEIAGLQCKAIVDRQAHLSAFDVNAATDPQVDQRKHSIRQPCQILLFAISILNDGKASLKNGDLIKFQQIIRGYRQIKEPAKTNIEILNYYKNNPIPTFQMINEYVFCFCQEQNVSLSAFQQNGHTFRY